MMMVAVGMMMMIWNNILRYCTTKTRQCQTLVAPPVIQGGGGGLMLKRQEIRNDKHKYEQKKKRQTHIYKNVVRRPAYINRPIKMTTTGKLL